MQVLAHNLHRHVLGVRRVEAHPHATRAVLFAVLPRVEAVVVKKGDFVLAVPEKPRVVLPFEGEEVLARRVVSFFGSDLAKLILFAAEGPDDGAGLAVDQVDGVHVAGRDEVVACLGLGVREVLVSHA